MPSSASDTPRFSAKSEKVGDRIPDTASAIKMTTQSSAISRVRFVRIDVITMNVEARF